VKKVSLVYLLWLVNLLFCVTLVADLLPSLRGDLPRLLGETGWVWPHKLPRWLWLLPCILGVTVYVLGALRLLNEPQTAEARYPVLLILWAFAGAALLPLLLMTLEGRPLFLLFTRSASPLTGGYQVAAALTLVLLVVSGAARGETGRVWFFFAPIWILIAADVLLGLPQRERAAFLAMQAVCLLSMAAVIRANFTALTVPPEPPAPVTQAPSPSLRILSGARMR
jgi:hypothetical protein